MQHSVGHIVFGRVNEELKHGLSARGHGNAYLINQSYLEGKDDFGQAVERTTPGSPLTLDQVRPTPWGAGSDGSRSRCFSQILIGDDGGITESSRSACHVVLEG
jgi:hypothetical protein